MKKTVWQLCKLVSKVSNIEISGFVLETKYDKDKSVLENKIPYNSGIVKKLMIVLKLLK